MSWVRVVSVSLALAFLGCTGINAEWNLESQGDLAGRRTFSLHALADRPTEFANVSQDVWKRRQDLTRTLILTELTGKGYRQSSASPDFLVHYATGVKPKDGAFSIGATELEGEVDIHAVDPTSKRWIWHGWATETMTSKLDGDAEIQKAVAEILAKFPPAS